MSSGLILGRSPNALIGTIAAVFNVFVLANVPFHWDGAVVGAINVAIGAVVLYVANSPGIQIAAGNAAQDRAAK